MCGAPSPLKTAGALGVVERIDSIVWGTFTAKDSRGTWCCRKDRIQSCGARIGFSYVWGTYTAKDSRDTWCCRKDRIELCVGHIHR